MPSCGPRRRPRWPPTPPPSRRPSGPRTAGERPGRRAPARGGVVAARTRPGSRSCRGDGRGQPDPGLLPRPPRRRRGGPGGRGPRRRRRGRPGRHRWRAGGPGTGRRRGGGGGVGPVLPLVRWVRARYPELPISVDTWRAEVAEAVLSAGADLVNDTWAGHDPELVAVAAAHGAGIVCSHTGGLPPRTDPLRTQFRRGTSSAPGGPGPDAGDSLDGVLGDVVATATARRAAALTVATTSPRTPSPP